MSILIVDDSATMRKIFQKTLQEIDDFSIKEAQNGKEALELIKENEEINYLFLDVNMPIMNGRELIIELKKENLDKRLNIILISTEVSAMDEDELKNLGVVGAISKPFKISELKNILSSLVKIKEKEEKMEKINSEDLEKEEEIEEIEKIEIVLKKSIEDCIEEYVDIYTKELKNTEQEIKGKKQLDYKRMKRFMMTAYNNLIDIDHTLRLSNLNDAKENLLKVESIYDGFSKSMGSPKSVAYEEIFLHLQEDYMFYYDKAEKLKYTIDVANKKIRLLHEKLQSQKKYISELRKNAPDYEATVNEYKSDNKIYADLMHNLAIFKEELLGLNDGLKTFRDAYYDEFVGKFENVYVDYDKKLLSLLNIKCHQLDTIMWEKAKHSKPIRNFFEKSRITGGFSTQTFLEYHLKSVDKDKISEENAKLFELLEYLKIINNKTITIIHSDMDEMLKMKAIIESITTGYRVSGFTTPLKLLDKSIKKQDLVILDYEMRTLDVKDFFKKYKKMYKIKDDEVNFLLLFSAPKKDILVQAIELGVLNMKYKNFLIKPEHLNQKKLEDKLNMLL